jgi:hypothetical protein
VAHAEREIGEFIGAYSYAPNLAGLYFQSHVLGYRDWLWVSVLTLGKDLAQPAVLEVFMTPDQSALLPHPWLDWSLRLKPDDANNHDVLPYRADDPNLTDGLDFADLAEEITAATPSKSDQKSGRSDQSADRPADFDITEKLSLLQEITQLYALSRERLLSPDGREQAAERWYASDQGPNGPSAQSSPLPCSTCGFFVPILGALGQAFGICANNWSQDDGKVVSYDHGCGSHSESRIPPIINRYLGATLEIDESIEWT